MLRTLKTALLTRLRNHPVAYVRAHAALSRHPLPPGDLRALEAYEKADRAFIRRRADQLGPVFKGLAWGELCVCIIGLSECRRLTQAHAADLRVDTLTLGHLIPKGFLCAMEGLDHRQYRGFEVRALRGLEGMLDDLALERIASHALCNYASRAAEHQNSSAAFSSAMSALATRLLVALYFGAEPDSAEHHRLVAHFNELGPYGLVWNPRERQERAYAALRDYLQLEVVALRAGTGTLRGDSLLGRLADAESLDETMLGNLIYQAEMGRSDLKNFFRWLTRHVADDPAVLDRIASEQAADSRACSLAQAFVLETLRTDQSERMMRRAVRDILFDGFLIPQHTLVRLCLWESHHAPGAFPDPLCFDPARFVDESPTSDRFAPFGVDHHQCPLGGVVIRLGVAFLRALARGYRLTPLVPGPAIRGAYHWEPASKFAVGLAPR